MRLIATTALVVVGLTAVVLGFLLSAPEAKPTHHAAAGLCMACGIAFLGLALFLSRQP